MSVPYSLSDLSSSLTDCRYDLRDCRHHIRDRSGTLVRLAGGVDLCQRRTLSHHGVRRAILDSPYTASVTRLTRCPIAVTGAPTSTLHRRTIRAVGLMDDSLHPTGDRLSLYLLTSLLYLTSPRASILLLSSY